MIADAFVKTNFARLFYPLKCQQGVALTGRDTTGPPCNVTVELSLDWRRHDTIAWPARLKQTIDYDDRRRQTPDSITILAPTLCVGGPVIINF